MGIEATSEIIERLEARVSRKELNNPEALYRGLQEELAALLAPVSAPLGFEKESDGPFVILVVGVNGVGKTTIGKLTQRFQREGKSSCWQPGIPSVRRRWNSLKCGANATVYR